MPRFYFHIRDGDTLIADPEGSDLPGLEEARLEALESARSILAERVKAGSVIKGQRIEIMDETGKLQAVLLMKDAIRLA